MSKKKKVDQITLPGLEEVNETELALENLLTGANQSNFEEASTLLQNPSFKVTVIDKVPTVEFTQWDKFTPGSIERLFQSVTKEYRKLRAQAVVTQGFQTSFANLPKDEESEEEESNQDDTEEESEEEIDYEKLSPKQLVDLASAKTVKQVEKLLKGFAKDTTKEITSTKRLVNNETLKNEIKEARGKYTDLDEYKEEIGKLAKTYKNLGVEDLYLLAKAKSPDKVKELEEKKKSEKSEEDQKKKPRFGGLTPTSSLETSNKGKMSKKDAMEAAWESEMSEIDPRIIGQNND